jgi:N-sulfoglucosamine sulfohydrolase
VTDLIRTAKLRESPPNLILAIADDWGRHAGAYGDRFRTPAFDRLAQEGALFTRAFTPAPSCSPARASLLTGLYPHRLGTGVHLSGPLPDLHPRYSALLAATGYHVGCVGKGYGPAWSDPEAKQKAGKPYRSVEAFLEARPKDRPFALWLGSSNPHRPYSAGLRLRRGVDPARVAVPPFLPDTTAVREDLADYQAEVEAFDAELADLLAAIERLGETKNTLIAVTSDNGIPFPRAKTNLYDAGCAVPLALRWPARVRPGLKSDALVSHIDLCPTFLEAAGVRAPASLDGRSLIPILERKRGAERGRDAVVLARETHVPHPGDNGGYSMRALRTADYLYIRNQQSERWPAGPPEPTEKFPSGFVDCDEGAAKRLLADRFRTGGDRLADLAFGKRPSEELYDLKHDPYQMNNLADDSKARPVRERLAVRLKAMLTGKGGSAEVTI